MILISDAERECSSGPMDQFMKDIGTKIVLTDKEDLFILMVMYMMAHGRMIRHMDLENTPIRMAATL